MRVATHRNVNNGNRPRGNMGYINEKTPNHAAAILVPHADTVARQVAVRCIGEFDGYHPVLRGKLPPREPAASCHDALLLWCKGLWARKDFRPCLFRVAPS